MKEILCSDRVTKQARWPILQAQGCVLRKTERSPMLNLVPRVLSYSPDGARDRKTLENAGHVSPRIWEITNKRFGGGAGKCEICLYRA